MEFLIDSININEIKELVEYLPIAGVTSNPSIVKKEAPTDYIKHLKEIKDIIGPDRLLHIQVIGTQAEEYIDQAKTIIKNIDKDAVIKVPTTFEGVKAIKILKSEGYKITATAIYDLLQSYLALEAGADFIAPYVNRISNIGADPFELIYNLSEQIKNTGSNTKILGASFKTLGQIEDAINSGAQSVTLSPELLRAIFNNINVESAVNVFNKDWYDLYHHYSI